MLFSEFYRIANLGSSPPNKCRNRTQTSGSLAANPLLLSTTCRTSLWTKTPDRSRPLQTNPTAAVLLLLLGAASSLCFPPTHQATSRASPHSVTVPCALSGRSVLGNSQDPLCLQPGTQLCEPPMILGAPHNPLCPTAWLSAFCASPNPPVPPIILCATSLDLSLLCLPQSLCASHDPFCLPWSSVPPTILCAPQLGSQPWVPPPTPLCPKLADTVS